MDLRFAPAFVGTPARRATRRLQLIEPGLYDFAQYMEQKLVSFLNSRGGMTFDQKLDIGDSNR